MNIDGIGSDELIVRQISGGENTTRNDRAIEETRISEEHGYTAVWNLDSLSCLLFIRDKYKRSGWRYGLIGNILAQWSNCKSFKLRLDEFLQLPICTSMKKRRQNLFTVMSYGPSKMVSCMYCP